MLFIKNESEYEPYSELALDGTIDGKIYREIFIRAMDVIKLAASKSFTEDGAELINDALGRVGLYQRTRLQVMSRIVPRDFDQTFKGPLLK